MRFLFLIDHFYKGGAEISLLNLLRCLSAEPNKHEIDFMVMDQEPIEKAISLIDQIPSAVHVLDIWKMQNAHSITNTIGERLLLTENDKSYAPASAHLYVRKREYDWAFHVGEWWQPTFTALKVRAKHKAAWIHNDLSMAEYFNADTYFKYDNYMDRYIFVSNNSMVSSVEAFPFIKSKSVCIYNISNAENIRQRAKEKVEENYFEMGLPVLVTCANIRKQKNHERQLEVMNLLKKRGLDFIWLNIGATTEKGRCENLLLRAKELGLEDRFILTGAKENPYKYMLQANAVTVLSDYESWSMVITEAKILGIPVISTKTSGALEQIVDGETGLLTDFSTTHIAEQIEKFLQNMEIGQHIRNNLKDFDNTNEILSAFKKLITDYGVKENDSSRKILYVIDDINSQGGAHIATKLQIQAFLKDGQKISIFSSSTPSAGIRTELTGTKFLSWMDFREDSIYNRRLLDCLFDSTLERDKKKYKISLTLRGKFKRKSNVFSEMVAPKLSDFFSNFDTVCVISEGSGFREIVAACHARRKIQWIHTDYCAWKDKTKWTKQITKNDAKIYEKFDNIVVLTAAIKNDFLRLYPHLTGKVVVNRNLIPVKKICDSAKISVKDPTLLKFVTVGRIDQWKAYDRLFEVLRLLYRDGYRFYWTIVGGGEDFDRVNALFANSEFANYVELTGHRSNPYSFMKEADVFALLSRYEGLPNTIYEALILGTPVIATNVGGISQQIQNGKTGWVVENNVEGIYCGLKFILNHPEQIAQAKAQLVQYQYDNDSVLRIAKKVFFE